MSFFVRLQCILNAFCQLNTCYLFNSDLGFNNIFHVTAWPHVSAQSWDWTDGCYKNTPYTFHTHPLSHMGCGPHVVGPSPYERVGVYRVCKWYFFLTFSNWLWRAFCCRGAGFFVPTNGLMGWLWGSCGLYSPTYINRIPC
jgi:hypothetical protein